VTQAAMGPAVAPVTTVTRTKRRLRRPRNLAHAALVYAMLAVLVGFILLPVSWMLTAALKPDTAPIFTNPPEWFPTQYWRWQTFADALLNPDDPYLLYSFNSAVLVTVNVVFAVIANSIIAYPFARLRFRGRNLLFGILLATMFLPAPVLLIPQYLIFNEIGWYGTYFPLTIPALAGNAFFIFLLRQYMRTIPKDLDEAARIDGAGHWQIYRHVILPLAAPALVVVAVFTALGTWNDFFGPLIYIDEQSEYTVALALATQVSRVGTQWNILMASNLVAILPVLVIYFLAQKRLIGGIASVGIRG
jgi:multiple sugar transport system permease protein